MTLSVVLLHWLRSERLLYSRSGRRLTASALSLSLSLSLGMYVWQLAKSQDDPDLARIHQNLYNTLLLLIAKIRFVLRPRTCPLTKWYFLSGHTDERTPQGIGNRLWAIIM